MHERGDSVAAFVVAKRHSRRVRTLRIFIPTAAVVGLSVVVLGIFLNPLRALNNLPTTSGKLSISGTKIKMEAPRVAGFTKDERGYELTAEAAAQDLLNPTIVELKEIRAKIEMQDKVTVKMLATTGLYDTKGEKLTLSERILLQSSSGYEAQLSEANIDMRQGHIVSRRPVQVRMLQGKLDAKELEIMNSGEVIRFHGGVEMNLRIDPKSVSKDEAKP